MAKDYPVPESIWLEHNSEIKKRKHHVLFGLIGVLLGLMLIAAGVYSNYWNPSESGCTQVSCSITNQDKGEKE